MTDYSVNRPGDGTPLSPTYQRYPGQLGTISPFPADYVGALNGALGQIDISAAMRSFQGAEGLNLAAPEMANGGHSPDFAAEAARQYLSSMPISPVPISPAGGHYGQPGSGNSFPGPLAPVITNPNLLQGSGGPVSPSSNIGTPYGVSPFGVVPGFPLVSGYNSPFSNRMTGNYGPAAAAAAAAAAGNMTGRTVYIGNIPDDASADELLNLVRFGPIESVKILSDKSCVFISFLDGSTAAAFYADAQVKKLALRGQELRIGWGRESNLPSNVAIAVQYNQATRNVFIGGLTDEDTEQTLRSDLVRFGDIDQIKIVRDKNIAFVHFLSISVAIKVVGALPREPAYKNKRVGYGKDRCAYVPRAQQAAVRQAVAQAQAAVQSHNGPLSPYGFLSPTGFNSPFSPVESGFNSPGGFNGNSFDPAQIGNRSVYLGNIGAETTVEELCNNIRGGVLESIKVLPEKKCAFITFVDPSAALAFFRHSEQNPITIAGRRLRVGWGKCLAPPSPKLLQDVNNGVSRNVYIGQITDFDVFTQDKLRTDFGEYGEIELINFLKEKHAAYVNFTSIEAAQKAITGIKNKADYADLRIAHGKDRCGYAPRQPRASGGRRETSPRDGEDPVAAAIAAAEATMADAPSPAAAEDSHHQHISASPSPVPE